MYLPRAIYDVGTISSRFSGLLPRCKHIEPEVLDLIGIGSRRGISVEIRSTGAPQQGDDGPAPGHGPNGVLPLEGGWLFRSARLGRSQATHARTIDGALNSDLTCV